MFVKKIKLILIFIILYQSPLYSKSTSFKDFNSRTLSNYFSGIVAFENKDNSNSLNFFNTSKALLNKHKPYFKRYVYTLVLGRTGVVIASYWLINATRVLIQRLMVVQGEHLGLCLIVPLVLLLLRLLLVETGLLLDL